MGKTLDITDEQRDQATRNIENGFAFTEDVLEDPTLLDNIPDGAEVTAIPKAQRDPSRQYDIETPRMVATITSPMRQNPGMPNGAPASRRPVKDRA